MLQPKELQTEQIKNFDSDNYFVQKKIDGFRAIFLNKNLLSERRVNENFKFPQIIDDLKIDATLDGEIFFGENLFSVNRKENWRRARYCIFDIIFYKDVDLSNMPLTERQEILQKIVRDIDSEFIVMPMEFQTIDEGIEFVKRNNFEGLVIKKKDSRYHDRNILDKKNTNDWLKWKNWREGKEEIIGFEKGSVKGAFILKNGSRISSLSPDYETEYNKMKEKGKVFAEFTFLYRTENDCYFQPRLKRLSEG